MLVPLERQWPWHARELALRQKPNVARRIDIAGPERVRGGREAGGQRAGGSWATLTLTLRENVSAQECKLTV